jgi:glycosyltransferase involved in cell wall biosynthesis
MDVSIVIPCFNEEEGVAPLLIALDAAVAALEARGRNTEVIIIDDGSKDHTFDRLEAGTSGRPWLRLVQLRRNYGQTAAMSAGFHRARGEFIVPMDADLQNDPSDIPMLIEKLDEGHDVVSGWRKHRKDTWLTRKLPSRMANWVIGRATGVKLHDYGCTLKAYRAEYLRGVRLYGEMHRFIPVYAHWEGARITEVVVKHHARTTGRSKYGLGRSLKVLLDLITLKLLHNYSTKPLYLFGRWGLLLCVLGVILAGIALAEKLVNGVWVHRNPLALLAVMLFIVGVQLVGLGLLAELQVRTYHESQQKPTYAVRREVGAPREPSS